VSRDHERKAVENVCKALRTSRLDQEISQQRLAEMAGISRTGLRHIESLQTSPTLYTLLRISRALQVDLADLLEDV